MRLEKLNLRNLRNHSDTEIELSKGINIFYGKNGAGKTTILEAISICGFSKTFLPVNDSVLIKQGEDNYFTSSLNKSDLGFPYKVSVEFNKNSRKRINSNEGDNLLPKDIIGNLPMVILSPDFKNITFGSPKDRRNFMDRLMSQTSRVYLDNLMDIRKALKQRNVLLGQVYKNGSIKSWITPWTSMIIEKGAEIVTKRYKFIDEFRDYFKRSYKEISSGIEEVDIEYQPNSLDIEEIKEDPSKEKIISLYEGSYQKYKEKEYKRGTTLFGPQKDELKIMINGGIAKEIASQGQHKSLLISIKFAEFNYLSELNKETPVVLLDDIFSELDENRSSLVLNKLIESTAQTFITVTEADKLKKFLPSSDKVKYFEVDNSKVIFKN